MVTSVNRHKGFYIGRYEASINGTVAQSKRGQIAKVEILQTDSISACTNNTEIPNMHLMYGIEWDTTLNWLNDNAIIAASTEGTTKTLKLVDIQTDSRTWGNYSNSIGNAATGKGSIQKTGTSEYWKANNIYDLAGNVFEWTQEKNSTGTSRANRGGSGRHKGDEYPVATRNSYPATEPNINIRL